MSVTVTWLRAARREQWVTGHVAGKQGDIGEEGDERVFASFSELFSCDVKVNSGVTTVSRHHTWAATGENKGRKSKRRRALGRKWSWHPVIKMSRWISNTCHLLFTSSSVCQRGSPTLMTTMTCSWAQSPHRTIKPTTKMCHRAIYPHKIHIKGMYSTPNSIGVPEAVTYLPTEGKDRHCEDSRPAGVVFTYSSGTI